MILPKSKSGKFCRVNSPTVKPWNPKDVQRIETMRAHFAKHPAFLGTVAPTATKIVNLDVTQLWEADMPTFQRDFQMKRMKEIMYSMEVLGIQNKIFRILVNTSMLPLDGRHTILAHYVHGINTIKAVVLDFKCEEDEIYFFNYINKSKQPMKKEHELFTYYQADEPLACLIYRLAAEDQRSKWCGKVGLLDVTDPASKMSFANFSKIVNWVGLEVFRHTEIDNKPRLNKRIQETDYELIRARMDEFHDWYYMFASPVRMRNEIYHTAKVLVTMMNFYHYTAKQNDSSSIHLKKDRILNAAVACFKNDRNWSFETLSNFGYKGALREMVAHFNRGREKYKMELPADL